MRKKMEKRKQHETKEKQIGKKQKIENGNVNVNENEIKKE